MIFRQEIIGKSKIKVHNNNRLLHENIKNTVVELGKGTREISIPCLLYSSRIEYSLKKFFFM